MNPRDRQDLRLEVNELTGMLRSHEALRGLREALLSRGLDPGAVLLAGFVEDEEEREFGAIVTPAGRVYTYERLTHSSSSGFSKFQEALDVDGAMADYPAVELALEMARDRGGA